MWGSHSLCCMALPLLLGFWISQCHHHRGCSWSLCCFCDGWYLPGSAILEPADPSGGIWRAPRPLTSGQFSALRHVRVVKVSFREGLLSPKSCPAPLKFHSFKATSTLKTFMSESQRESESAPWSSKALPYMVLLSWDPGIWGRCICFLWLL